MRIKRFFLFAGGAIAGAALFASCGEKEQIGGEDDPKNPDSEVVLKDGQVVEHTFVRKAAAITVGTYSMSLPRIITIDGPFAFAIRDDISRTHLFMGRVNSID